LDNKLDDWGGWEDDDEGEGEEGVEAATEEAKKDVEEEEEEEREAEQDADNDATNETDAQGEEATAAETATEPAADEPAPVEVAAQHNAAEKSTRPFPFFLSASSVWCCGWVHFTERIRAGSASAEEVAPVEEEEAAAPQEDSELVPTSPQVGEGDDDWDAWE
jgi:hypothetical protein